MCNVQSCNLKVAEPEIDYDYIQPISYTKLPPTTTAVMQGGMVRCY